MKSQRVIYFKFKVNVIFKFILKQTKNSKHFVSKSSYRHSRCIIIEGVFILYMEISLLFRLLMSIYFKNIFTEPNWRKSISSMPIKIASKKLCFWFSMLMFFKSDDLTIWLIYRGYWITLPPPVLWKEFLG